MTMRRKNADPRDLLREKPAGDDEACKGKSGPESAAVSSSVSSPEEISRQVSASERRRNNSQGGMSLWHRDDDSRQIKKIAYPLTKNYEKRQRFRKRLYFLGVTLLLISLIGVSIGLYNTLSSLTEATRRKKTTIILPSSSAKIPQHLLLNVRRHSGEIPIVFSGILPFSRQLKPGGSPYQDEILQNEKFDFYYPEILDDEGYEEAQEPDYGPIDLKFITEENQQRHIYGHLSERVGNARHLDQERDGTKISSKMFK
jgi:hypothetical protein